MVQVISPISYEIVQIDGVPARLDSRAIVLKAVTESRPVIAVSYQSYVNLYQVFGRLQISHEAAAKCRATRQQIGPNKWFVWFLPKNQEPEAQDFDQGYEPKRGRYKRYAERLANGEEIVFADRSEAEKAQGAWQLYVPKEKRRRDGVRSKITPIRKTGEWCVEVVSVYK